MLTNLVVAPSSAASQLLEFHGTNTSHPSFEAKGLDNAALAALWSSIDSEANQKAIDGLEGDSCLIAMAESKMEWVFLLPPRFVDLLASLGSASEERLLQIATVWVALSYRAQSLRGSMEITVHVNIWIPSDQ